MTAIWENSGDGWHLLPSAGFPDEATLHDLVADAPHLLPLSGSPHLTVLGREVGLGGGSADLVAIEPSGRIAIVEIKLKRNSEARRAVVAQVLSYAAALHGLDALSLESELLTTELAKRGYASCVDAVRVSGYDGSVDDVEFRAGLDECLAAGAFRLVLVLDEAPPDLVRLVGYLEAKTDGLIIDLVTVAAHDVGTSRLIVPRRVEPGREATEVAKRVGPAPSERLVTDGAGDFRASIAEASPESQPGLMLLCDWAEGLAAAGLANLSTKHDKRGWKVLRPVLPTYGAGIVTIWNDGSALLQIWRSVLEKVAPAAIPRIEAILGGELPMWSALREFTPELLDAIEETYEVGARLRKGFDWSRVSAAVDAMPAGAWTTYGDLAEFAGTSAIAVGQWVTSQSAPSKAYRVLGANGKPRPDFRWDDAEDRRDVRDVLAGEGVRFGSAGAADATQRLGPSDLATIADKAT